MGLKQVYGLEPLEDIVVTGKEVSELLEENEFLYDHFVEDNDGLYRNDIDYLREENKRIRQELETVTKQRDDLGWRLTETRKSKSYKIAMILTSLPRKLRNHNAE